jgi:hypothetical protein
MDVQIKEKSVLASANYFELLITIKVIHLPSNIVVMKRLKNGSSSQIVS